MAFQRRTRLALRVAGVAGLAVGLFPYYSHTSGPPPDAGVPPLQLPGVGALPDRSSSTLVRLGLPFSPLYRYQREDSFSAETSTTPAAGGSVTVQSGEAAFTGEVKTVKFSSGFSSSWRVEFLSWSAAVAAVGIVLVVVSFLARGRNPAPPPAADAGGTGTGPSAGPPDAVGPART
jgi:hypothetical protein